jgi:hypothetical protein
MTYRNVSQLDPIARGSTHTRRASEEFRSTLFEEAMRPSILELSVLVDGKRNEAHTLKPDLNSALEKVE